MISTSTGVIDGSLFYILAMCALLFFVNIFVMVYFVVRFRKSRNPKASELTENPILEIIWISIPTVLVTTMFIYGLTGFRFLRNSPQDSIAIKVIARQWSWLFEYPNGKKSAELIVPLGKDVRCDLVSSDVIHGFYVPAFRIQQDVVPGIKTYVWFNATTLGTSTILCSQYCGQKHSAMLANLIVVPADQYDAWMQGKKIKFGGSPYANMPPGQALLYERGCVSCHSLTGTAMVGPTFKGLFGSNVNVMTLGQMRTVSADSAYIAQSIIHPGADVVEGFPNTMPPSRDVLSDQEIAEIVAYLKSAK